MIWWEGRSVVDILVDNESWILPHARDLQSELLESGFASTLYRHQEEVLGGDVLFLLGCTQIFKESKLELYARTLVVHESALPRGKGFAPMTWQILEGESVIPFSLIEATAEVDSGAIYLQRSLELDGTELCDELRHMQGVTTKKICLEYIRADTEPSAICQVGEDTFYARRTPEDSELDVTKSIDELFNQLRVVDNRAYPAFFKYRGKTYQIKISKMGED